MARATGAPADEVLRAAAASLAGFSSDQVALVTACRRLIDRHPELAPVWWLCSRVLTAADPADEAWRCLDDWVSDRTTVELGHAIPEGATVAVVGSADRLLPSFAARGDTSVVVIDVEGDGYGFVRRLEEVDVSADSVDVARLGAAVAAADLVILDLMAAGPDLAVAPPGSWPVAAVARTSGVPTWSVAGVGRVVAPATWPAFHDRVKGSRTVDLVPADIVGSAVGPSGPEPWLDAVRRGDMPDAPELRR